MPKNNEEREVFHMELLTFIQKIFCSYLATAERVEREKKENTIPNKPSHIK